MILDIENNILSLTQVFEYFNKMVDKNLVINQLRNHEDYPSFLSYFEVFERNDINVYPIKISESQIEQLEFPLLALLFNVNHGNLLCFINRVDKTYQIYVKDKVKIFNIDELKEVWLGFVFYFKDSIINNIQLNDYDNYINFDSKNVFGSVIGMRNKLENNAFNFNLHIDIVGNDNTILIGDNTDIRNLKVKIRGNKNKLIIDENCRISGSFLLENGNCKIFIDKDTTIEFADILASEDYTSVEIGTDCMLSSGIIINTSDSHSIIDKKSKKRLNRPKNIVIKNNVWIARNAMILKGVEIENDCVVGAGSVVTKSLKANSIYAGNPAKLIKDDTEWRRELLPFD